jgi:hypothetical protein
MKDPDLDTAHSFVFAAALITSIITSICAFPLVFVPNVKNLGKRTVGWSNAAAAGLMLAAAHSHISLRVSIEIKLTLSRICLDRAHTRLFGGDGIPETGPCRTARSSIWENRHFAFHLNATSTHVCIFAPFQSAEILRNPSIATECRPL